jgi:hypothetical protein
MQCEVNNPIQLGTMKSAREILFIGGRYGPSPVWGGLSMSKIITLPAPVIDKVVAPAGKWEREYRAFRRLLPQLLTTHRGQYVAIHEEQVVDCGDDKLALAFRVLARVGNVDIHIGHVTGEPEPVSRSGVRREVRPGGDVL